MRKLTLVGAPPEWPEGVPDDFRLRMLDALSYRNVTPEHIWDEVRDWLDMHDVRAAPVRPRLR